MLLVVGLIKPIPASALSHTPPGAIGSKIVLHIVAVAFVLSLVRPVRSNGVRSEVA